MIGPAHAVEVVGVGAALRAREGVAQSDRNLLDQSLVEQFPSRLVGAGADAIRSGLRQAVFHLLEAFGHRPIVLIGQDIDVLEALAIGGHREMVTVVSPPGVSGYDFAMMERNVPSDVQVRMLEPGVVPCMVAPETIVMVVGFDAGASFVLLPESVWLQMSMVNGLPFFGETVLVSPLTGIPVHDRPAGWQSVDVRMFRWRCGGEGLAAVRDLF